MSIKELREQHEASIKVLQLIEEADTRIRVQKDSLERNRDLWPTDLRWKVIKSIETTKAAKERLKNRYAKIQTNGNF